MFLMHQGMQTRELAVLLEETFERGERFGSRQTNFFFLNYKITLLLFTFYFIFFLMRERLVDYFFTSLSCDNR